MTEYLMNEEFLAELGRRIDSEGIDAHDTEVRRLAGLARWFEVSPHAAAVLVSGDQAEVARLRAFSVVVRAVLRAQGTVAVEEPLTTVAAGPAATIVEALEPTTV